MSDAVFIDSLDLPDGGAKVLDVGAAGGANALALRRAGYRVTAVEIDEGLVERFGPAAATNGVQLCRGDGMRLPFRRASFDAAIVVEVFEHVDTPERLLSELERVLRPGGRLCVALPTGYTEAIYWRLHPAYSRNAGHVRRYRKADVEGMLRRSGFAVDAITTRNFVPAVSWLFHAALRSGSDQTGQIFDHLWIDRVLRVVFAVWRRVPLVGRTLTWLERRFGKSWYFYGAKPA